MVEYMSVAAKDIQRGDRLASEDGTIHYTVERVERANWIRTTEGPCIWIFFKGSGGDVVASKSDEFKKLL